MRISDWSSDVCSSDLGSKRGAGTGAGGLGSAGFAQSTSGKHTRQWPGGRVACRVAERELMTGAELPRFVPGPDDWDLESDRTSGFDASGSPARHSMTDRRTCRLADYVPCERSACFRDVRAGHLLHCWKNVRPAHVALPRSEEHTSGLPSLMR